MNDRAPLFACTLSCAFAVNPAKATVARAAELSPRKFLLEECSIIDLSFECSLMPIAFQIEFGSG
jgi:hypothetical protein